MTQRPFYQPPTSPNIRIKRKSRWWMVWLGLTAAGVIGVGLVQLRPAAISETAETPPIEVPPTSLQPGEGQAKKAQTNETRATEIPTGDFVLMAGGVFVMGDTLDGLRNALPHGVRLDAFMIGTHEVTLEQWDKVVRWGSQHGYSDLPQGTGKGETHPVYQVAWIEVVKWCNARSEMEGLTPCYYTDQEHHEVLRVGVTDIPHHHVNWQAEGYRLPTEAEWEMAARGGVSSRRFPWGDVITHELANYAGAPDLEYDHCQSEGNAPEFADSLPYTAPVGSFPANGLGLYDMAGNVAEWCWDAYDPNYGSHDGSLPALTQNPRGSQNGTTCIARGGSWRHTAAEARCASRFELPGDPQLYVGFRIVRKP